MGFVPFAYPYIRKTIPKKMCFVLLWTQNRPKMWKKLLNTEYFLYLEDLEVSVTNYVLIWRLQFSETSFLACLKDSNFGMEIDQNELVHNGSEILKNPERLKAVRCKEDGNHLELKMTMLFGYPLKLQMKLTEGSKELFFSKVTLKLLKTVQDLHSSQRELRQLLHKKDLEIGEYKCEGGEIALRFLKTSPYSDTEHMSKHPAYREHFGCEDVPDCLLNKTAAEPERAVKAEPTITDVKREKRETLTTEPPAHVKKEDNNIAIKRESPERRGDGEGRAHMHLPARKQRRKLNL